ncbi:MAG TPA: TonB-dependent receptor, partial [Steroidobacteraceae bacterium]|nr:TonB-dependent receptor [Steroidobacteraceae bacterium]
HGPYETDFALVEGQGPLTDHLSAAVCVGYVNDFLVDGAKRSESAIFNTAVRLRPTDGVELKAFWNYDPGGAHGILPAVYTDNLLPPPTYDARSLPSQASSSEGWRQLNVGLMLKMTLPGDWRLNAGVFQSAEHDLRTFTEEFLSVVPDRQADHVLDVSPPTSVRSDSGELRLVRDFAVAGVDRDLQFSIRGRDVDREYGGDALIDYGFVSIDAPLSAETAPFATGAVSLDAIRQFDLGVAYQERRPGVGSLGFALLKSDYTRTIEAPGASAQTDSASPWLLNLRFTADAGSELTLYGSYVQGLEDSALAPADAANRREAPPATRTRQADAGIHYAPSGKLSIVFGAFEIDKAYFNLDGENIYRELGRIRNRGLEGSLTYSEDGLTLLAGGVGLQPRVARSVPQPDATGDVPVGPVPLVLMVNLEYAPESWHSWAASLQWASYSSRVVTEDDRYSLPAFATLGAGVRYESKGHGHAWTLRLDGANLLGSEGLHVSTVGLLTPELGRRWILSFTVDS